MHGIERHFEADLFFERVILKADEFPTHAPEVLGRAASFF